MTKTSKEPADIERIYQQKAKQSFKSRFDLMLYYRVSKGISGEITEQDLKGFKIEDNPTVLTEYLNVYWQEEEDFEINGKKIRQIYLEMKQWRDDNKPIIDRLQKYYIANIFPVEVFKEEEFNTFFQGDIECEYCHIDEDKISNLISKGQIHKKHITRGWSLEIDRKIPNHEYTKDNCVWCCYWCNNAKTDEFSHKEFLEIGKTFENIWNARLSR